MGLDLEQFSAIQERPEVDRCEPSESVNEDDKCQFRLPVLEFGRRNGWAVVTCTGVPRVQENATSETGPDLPQRFLNSVTEGLLNLAFGQPSGAEFRKHPSAGPRAKMLFYTVTDVPLKV